MSPLILGGTAGAVLLVLLPGFVWVLFRRAAARIRTQNDREECLDAGMNDYMSKPVSRRALAEALDKWLPPEELTRQDRMDTKCGRHTAGK